MNKFLKIITILVGLAALFIVYVAPRKNVVIVRLGNAPDEQLIWPLAIHTIVDQMP